LMDFERTPVASCDERVAKRSVKLHPGKCRRPLSDTHPGWCMVRGKGNAEILHFGCRGGAPV
jgi:hypothetical protein